MNTTQNCDKLSQFCRRVTLLSESINKGNYIMRTKRTENPEETENPEGTEGQKG